MKPVQLYLVGLTSLQMAMKMEEVFLQSTRHLLLEGACHRDYRFSPQMVQEMERRIVTTLEFKLVTDSLLSWLELTLALWDCYVADLHGPESVYTFKLGPCNPRAEYFRPVHEACQLGDPANRFRQVLQAMDLMSMHIGVLDFSYNRLALALLALQLFDLYAVAMEQDPVNMQASVRMLDGQIRDWLRRRPEQARPWEWLLSGFIGRYFAPLMSENFDSRNWQGELREELLFAAQFFAFPLVAVEPHPPEWCTEVVPVQDPVYGGVTMQRVVSG